jgi:hypothetical protein
MEFYIMQVFLPERSFKKTARVLDKKRLFKQLVETRQILATNGVHILKNDGTPMKPTHPNHPIHKMWGGKYIRALRVYHNVILSECLRRGINTQIEPLPKVRCPVIYPDFIGNREFHDAHRSNLLRKDPEHYGKFGWNVPNDLNYIWGRGTYVAY